MSDKKVIAVVLSGCGFFDGAEIHESALTLLAIAKYNFKYRIFAPDIPQAQVINHITGNTMLESRNVLVEAARIARGQIAPISHLKVDDYSALIFPGGFGVAKNLCSFAFDGAECQANEEVADIIKAFHSANKPIGALCISPALIMKVLGKGQFTIGTDQGTANAIEKMGGKHVQTGYTDVIVDKKMKIVTSPCYMLDANILQIAQGTESAVKELISLIS